MNTFMAKTATIERKWYVVDAAGKTLGRLAAEVAKVLRGKNKPEFTPHVDTGDYVIVVNAEKISVTGTLREMLATKPVNVIEHAVRGMLPKGALGKAMGEKLFVYAGPDHPHQAQKPEELKF